MLVDLLRSLTQHDVKFLVVGGVGAVMQGASMTTRDLDIMPDPSPENLERLAAVLNAKSPRRKTGAESYDPVERVDSSLFRTNTIASFLTDDGPVDVLMEPPGVGTFDIVHASARHYRLGDFEVAVADIDDLITSKQTADRGKDWIAMPALYEARDRLRAFPDDYEFDPGALEPGDEA